MITILFQPQSQFNKKNSNIHSVKMNLQDVQNNFSETVAILFRHQGKYIIKVQPLSPKQKLIWKFHMHMVKNLHCLKMNL